MILIAHALLIALPVALGWWLIGPARPWLDEASSSIAMMASATLESVGDRLWSLTIAPDGHAGLTYPAGQFVWLRLNCSAFSVREHPFSIASAPSDWKALRFLIKEVGDFTRQIGALPIGARALSGRQAGARHLRDCRRRRAGAHAFLVAGGRHAR